MASTGSERKKVSSSRYSVLVARKRRMRRATRSARNAFAPTFRLSESVTRLTAMTAESNRLNGSLQNRVTPSATRRSSASSANAAESASDSLSSALLKAGALSGE